MRRASLVTRGATANERKQKRAWRPTGPLRFYSALLGNEVRPAKKPVRNTCKVDNRDGCLFF